MSKSAPSASPLSPTKIRTKTYLDRAMEPGGARERSVQHLFMPRFHWFAFWDRWCDEAEAECLGAPSRSLVRLVCGLVGIQEGMRPSGHLHASLDASGSALCSSVGMLEKPALSVYAALASGIGGQALSEDSHEPILCSHNSSLLPDGPPLPSGTFRPSRDR